MNLTPQEKNAADQRDRVRRAIVEAARRIRREILDTYDPETGLYRYDKNGSRVSEAEVLRRAGNVDKNTVKQPYHKKSRATLRRIVRWAKKKCERDEDALGEKVRNREQTSRDEIERLKQLLGASEARRDIAEHRARTAEKNEEGAVNKAINLEREVERLKQIIVEQHRKVH